MAKNFQTQKKLGKAITRLQMIATEFFEKGRCYSYQLAVYNTAWWIGNYCSKLKRLQFWGLKGITAWTDNFIETNYVFKRIKITPPRLFRNNIEFGCFGGKANPVCQNW